MPEIERRVPLYGQDDRIGVNRHTGIIFSYMAPGLTISPEQLGSIVGITAYEAEIAQKPFALLEDGDWELLREYHENRRALKGNREALREFTTQFNARLETVTPDVIDRITPILASITLITSQTTPENLVISPHAVPVFGEDSLLGK